MAETTQLRMAKATEEERQALRNFFEELEGLLDFGDSVQQFVEKQMEGTVGGSWQRILWGFETMIENACDPDLDYLEFKPEIREARKRIAELEAEVARLRNEAAEWQWMAQDKDSFHRQDRQRIAELEAELATLKARHSGTKEQLIAVANERDEGRLHIADLERLLRAALAENPTWHTDASTEAERLLDAAGESDEPDEPAVIDVPGKGKVLVQTDDDEAERVRRELDRRVKEAEERDDDTTDH